MKNFAKTVFWLFFSFGIVCAAAIIGGGLYMTLVEKTKADEPDSLRLAAETQIVPIADTSHEKTMPDIIENLLPSVVGVTSAADSDSSFYIGSGVIASDDGLIITNQHVISGGEKIVVTLYNGVTKEAKKIWSDAALDLAVIKIKGNSLPKARLGSVEKLRVGESVIAIGNPLSMQFERTVTAGIISALNRTISVDNNGISSNMEDLIQTDASINPGNSGGPLINSDGEVVGINTVKVSTAEGMGFAVPIDLCIPVIERIRDLGEFKTPYLGLYAYTAKAARYLNKDMNFGGGLYIARLDNAGPAFKAGLRYGDVIVRIDETSVNSMLDLRRRLFCKQPGESVKISFLREEEMYTLVVTAEEAPA